MNIVSDKEVLIFRNTKEDKVWFNAGLSKKDKEGNYENGTIQVQFKKDVDVPNMTKITIKNAWLTFYKTKEGKTVPYVFISQFEKEGQFIEVNENKDSFEDFGMEIQDQDLPF